MDYIRHFVAEWKLDITAGIHVMCDHAGHKTESELEENPLRAQTEKILLAPHLMCNFKSEQC